MFTSFNNNDSSGVAEWTPIAEDRKVVYCVECGQFWFLRYYIANAAIVACLFLKLPDHIEIEKMHGRILVPARNPPGQGAFVYIHVKVAHP